MALALLQELQPMLVVYDCMDELGASCTIRPETKST
jgi:hypothetical protein